MRDAYAGCWPMMIFSFWAGLGITWSLGSPSILAVRVQVIDGLTVYS